MDQMKEECFGYDKKMDKCRAVSDMYCKRYMHCPFYKTRQQYKDDLKKYGNDGGIS